MHVLSTCVLYIAQRASSVSNSPIAVRDSSIKDEVVALIARDKMAR